MVQVKPISFSFFSYVWGLFSASVLKLKESTFILVLCFHLSLNLETISLLQTKFTYLWTWAGQTVSFYLSIILSRSQIVFSRKQTSCIKYMYTTLSILKKKKKLGSISEAMSVTYFILSAKWVYVFNGWGNSKFSDCKSIIWVCHKNVHSNDLSSFCHKWEWMIDKGVFH